MKKKIGQKEIIEKNVVAMPYLYRLMKENGDKLFEAKTQKEMERQILFLMSLAFSFGYCFRNENEIDFN